MARTTVNKSLSFSPQELEKAKKRAAQKGFGNSFSAYVADLIRADVFAAGGLKKTGRSA